jgi:hypothetical protein
MRSQRADEMIYGTPRPDAERYAVLDEFEGRERGAFFFSRSDSLRGP